MAGLSSNADGNGYVGAQAGRISGGVRIGPDVAADGRAALRERRIGGRP